MNTAPIEFPGYAVRWVPDAHGRLRPQLRDRPSVPVTWAPMPGAQQAFLLDNTREVFFGGGRGNGKSDALLMAFARYVDAGYGADWRGVIFRKTFPELRDIIAKSLALFPLIFPTATYNQTTHEWRWPTGEVLIFAFMERPEDYYKYHGFAFTFIGWEELTTWPTDECYRQMFSCLRSSHPSVPRIVRSNSNSYGVGHQWVKARFRLPLLPGVIVGPVHRTEGEPDRRAIRGALGENRVLLAAEPNYADNLRAAATSAAQAKAWIDDDWNIVAGGMFDDVWNPAVHIVPPLPMAKVPASWRLDRSYDDGLAAPFAVVWWAESSGEPVTWEGVEIGAVRADLVAVSEWYGWSGTPNKGLNMSSREIAEGIVSHEKIRDVAGRVRPGPADTAIWNADPRDPRSSVATEMLKAGVTWERADKGPGSRVQGLKLLREMLKGAQPRGDGRREQPGLFVSTNCEQIIRTLPALPRDKRNPDDVDEKAEDHLLDAIRYRIRRLPTSTLTTRPLVF